MPLRVADAVSVLDALGVERAHFVGSSYRGRLGFGIGEHVSDRVLSLVIGGQQPYAIDPDGPIFRVLVPALDATRSEGVEAFVRALAEYAGVRFPAGKREQYLRNDPGAIEAACRTTLSEGAICRDLRAWQVRQRGDRSAASATAAVPPQRSAPAGRPGRRARPAGEAGPARTPLPRRSPRQDARGRRRRSPGLCPRRARAQRALRASPSAPCGRPHCTRRRPDA